MKIRIDGWDAQHDLVLADCILMTLRDGGTQLQGFKVASEALGKTPEACGFRWNSYVRKQYQEAIHMAKEQGRTQKGLKHRKVKVKKEKQKEKLHFVEIAKLVEDGFIEMAEGIEKLENENKQMRSRIEELEQMEKEYTNLLEIMNRARMMATKEPLEVHRFKMDQNGNLERME